MDESGCFFKALPTKGLAKKGKNTKGGTQSKQRITIAFFVSADGGKKSQDVLVWPVRQINLLKSIIFIIRNLGCKWKS